MEEKKTEFWLQVTDRVILALVLVLLATRAIPPDSLGAILAAVGLAGSNVATSWYTSKRTELKKEAPAKSARDLVAEARRAGEGG